MNPEIVGDILSGIAVVVAVIGLWFVVRQLKQVQAQQDLARRSATMSALLQLDQVFGGLSEQREWVRINQGRLNQEGPGYLAPYLAAFERVGWVVDGGFMPMAEAYRFFAGRLRHLLRTYEARRLLSINQGGWNGLVLFVLNMNDWAIKNGERKIIGALLLVRERPVEPAIASQYRRKDAAFLKKLYESGDRIRAELLAAAENEERV